MRIAVIGKGNIGGTLGSKWSAAGYDVVYGARDAPGTGPGGAPVLTVGDALQDAEIVLLAVPGQVVGQVVSQHGAALAGKIVIDAVNRIGAPETDARALIAAAADSADGPRTGAVAASVGDEYRAIVIRDQSGALCGVAAHTRTWSFCAT